MKTVINLKKVSIPKSTWLRLTLKATAFASLGLSITSCLNSSVSSSKKHTPSSGAHGISPVTIELSWNEATGEKTFQVYEESTASTLVAETRFSRVEIPVEEHRLYDFRVYRSFSNGSEKSKAFEFIKIKSWENFEGVQFSAQNENFFPTTIKWDYEPWSDSLKAGQSATQSTVAECGFLKDGTMGANVFDVANSRVLAASAFGEKIVDSACSLEGNANYLVGCRIRFADGHISTSGFQKTFKTPEQCVKQDSVFPTFRVDKVVPSAYLGYEILDSINGKFFSEVVGKNLNEDTGVVTESVLDSRTETHNFDTLPRTRTFSSALPHMGLARLRGTFESNSSAGGAAQVTPLDFYIKSIDSAKSVIYPPIVDVGSPMTMGASLASGDFDCDGADDMAVGLPALVWRQDTINGPVYQRTGGVVIFYGQVGGKLNFRNTEVLREPRDPSGPAARAPVLLLPEVSSSYDASGAQFGASLAVGNFNRDFNYSGEWRSCDDLAIGAPFEKNTQGDWAPAGGSVYIAYGGVSGLRGNWITPSIFTNFTGSCPVTNAFNAGAPTQLPSANLAGGLLALPRPMYESASGCSGTRIYSFQAQASQNDIGSNYYLGNIAAGDSGYYQAIKSNIFITSGTGMAKYSAASSAFGFSLSAGDFDHDGFDDLAVGAPQTQIVTPTDIPESFNGVPSATDFREVAISEAGAAFVYFGSSAGVRQKVSIDWTGANSSSEYQAASKDVAQYTTDTGADHLLRLQTSLSPIKFMPGNSVLAASGGTKLRFGHAVGIGRLQGEALSGSALTHDRKFADASDHGGTLFVGMPDFSWQGAPSVGAVTYAHWSTHLWSGTTAYQRNTTPVVLSEMKTNGGNLTWSLPSCVGCTSPAAPVLVNPLVYTPAGVLNPNAAGGQFGKSIAIGSLRPKDRLYPSSPLFDYGVDPFSGADLNQVVIVGTPENDGGRGAFFALNDSSLTYGHNMAIGNFQTSVNASPMNSNSVAVVSGYKHEAFGDDIVNKQIIGRNFGSSGGYSNFCTDSTNCSPAVMSAGLGGPNARFGTALAVGKQKRRSVQCGPSLTPNKFSVLNYDNVCFVKLSTDVDSLFVSSTGATTVSRFITGASSGLNSAAAASFQPGGLTQSTSFGTSITAGYYSGYSNQESSIFNLAVGVPTRAIPVSGNGDVYIFEPTASIPGSPSASLVSSINSSNLPFNIGAEAKGRFDESMPVGDVNCDGKSDVMFKVSYATASVNGALGYRLLLVFGSDKGLVTTGITTNYLAPRDTSTSPLTPQWIVPSQVGLPDEAGSASISGIAKNVIGVGDINGDGCDDVVIGNQKAYAYFGSPQGLITERTPSSGFDDDINEPSGSFDKTAQEINFPASYTLNAYPGPAPGFTPMVDPTEVGLPDMMKYVAGALSAMPITPVDLMGAEKLSGYAGVAAEVGPKVCYGDYNGDGFMDIATATEQGSTIGEARTLPGSVNPVLAASQVGTAMNGFLTIAYGSPHGIQFRAPLTSDKIMGDCTSASCRMSRLFHPSQFFSPSATTGVAAGDNFFWPIYPWQEGFVRVSMMHAASETVPVANVMQDRFGASCISVGDLDGDKIDDLVVPMPYKKSLRGGSAFLVFWGKDIKDCVDGGGSTDCGLHQSRSNFIHLAQSIVANDGTITTKIDGLGDTVSRFSPNSLLGATAVGAGDINADGKNDLVLSVGGENGIVTIFGGPHLRHKDLHASPGTTYDANVDIASEQKYWGAGAKGFRGSGGVCASGASANCYERWVKIGVLDSYQSNVACKQVPGPAVAGKKTPTCEDAQTHAFFTKHPSGATIGFGSNVVAVGDLNSDGYNDIVVDTPAASSVGQQRVGGSVTYFGGVNGLHTQSAPSKVSRCIGPAVGNGADKDTRSCVPNAMLPTFATRNMAGINNGYFYDNMGWHTQSTVQFKAAGAFNWIGQQGKGPNFGSRHPGSNVDVDSADLLMCVNDNFQHRDDPNRIRLGACGVYY